MKKSNWSKAWELATEVVDAASAVRGEMYAKNIAYFTAGENRGIRNKFADVVQPLLDRIEELEYPSRLDYQI